MTADASHPLQDSGLSDGRLLACLLQSDVVILDEHGAFRFASAGACALLGAPSEAALRDQWPTLAAQFGLSDIAWLSRDDAPIQGRVDLCNGAGSHPLRFELHAFAQNGHPRRVLLLRGRDRIASADRVLLLASEAIANRPVLSGLIHEAKGPLNNFKLTLALLAASIERSEHSATPPETLARWHRYLGLLDTEGTRLVDCLDDMHALAQAREPARERIDIGALLRDVVRVLRHAATMREAHIDLEPPPDPIWVAGDPRLLRLALSSLTLCVLDVSPPGADVTWCIEPVVADIPARSLRVTASRCVLPPDLAAEIFGIRCATRSDHVAAIAARTIIEAHGGDIALATGADGAAGFALRIPTLA